MSHYTRLLRFVRRGRAGVFALVAALAGYGCVSHRIEPARVARVAQVAGVTRVTRVTPGARAGVEAPELTDESCRGTPKSALLKPTDEAPSQCIVRTDSGALADLLVPLQNAEPLQLTLTGVPLEAAVRAGTTLADVRVTGAVTFKGVSRIDTYAVAHPTDLPGGFVHAGTRARLSLLRFEGKHAVGNLTIRDMVAKDVRIGCDALTLVAANGQGTQAAADPEPMFGADIVRPVALTDPADLTEGPGEFALFASPGSSEQLRLSGMLVFTRSNRKAEWSEVAARFDDGTVVSGWVPTTGLEAVPKGEEINISSEGLSLCGFGCAGGGEWDPETGKATVKANATVHATPGGEAWATITQDIELDASRRGPDAAWVRLTALPGLQEDHCDDIRHAYVAASATTNFRPEAN